MLKYKSGSRDFVDLSYPAGVTTYQTRPEGKYIRSVFGTFKMPQNYYDRNLVNPLILRSKIKASFPNCKFL